MVINISQKYLVVSLYNLIIFNLAVWNFYCLDYIFIFLFVINMIIAGTMLGLIYYPAKCDY